MPLRVTRQNIPERSRNLCVSASNQPDGTVSNRTTINQRETGEFAACGVSARLALPLEHGSVPGKRMRLALRVGLMIAGLIALNLGACRPKAKRATGSKPSASIVTMPPIAPSATRDLSERYRDTKPIETGQFSTLRSKAIHAIQISADKNTSPSDAMVALAQALADAPGSAVLAIELVKTAKRAHDLNRMRRFVQMASLLTASEPKLSKVLALAVDSKDAKSDLAPKSGAKTTAEAVTARPALKLSGVTELKGACGWIETEFKQGRPPVDYVGEQGTDSLECQMLAPYALTPDLKAATVLVAARGNGERVFAWVAAQVKGSIWLSRTVTVSFAPPFYPYGNGFSVELQKTAAYREGLPELTAYVAERSTVTDVALNEQSTTDQHRIIVMTFDTDPPQSSAPIVLHSRIERRLVDANDSSLPNGYAHSADVGSVVEHAFQLQWGKNRVTLTATGQAGTKPIERILFAE